MAEADTDEYDWTKTCILCKKILAGTETTTSYKQAMENYVKASKVRGDNHVETYLKDKISTEGSSILVHKNCTKTYGSKDTLKRFARNAKQTESQPTRCTRSNNVDFNFKNNCLYCGEVLLKNCASKDTISYVTTTAFRTDLLAQYANPTNPKAIAIKNRVTPTPCLIVVGAGYHRKCKKNPPPALGVKRVSEKSDICSTIINYMSERTDQVQFCLDEIWKNCGDSNASPNIKNLKAKLKVQIGNDFIIQISHGDILFSRISFARMLLSDYFSDSTKEVNDEKMKKVDESSAMCFKDIQNMKYDTKFYPPQDQFLKDSEKLVPESLRRYLYNIVAKHIEKPEKWNRVINSIAHAIIKATKPLSFVSPVLLNLGAVLHRMFGSKELVDFLFANGFSESYTEIRRYLSSVIRHEEENEYTNAFSQLVFDNADHNVDTIDGRDTFHTLGRIQIITPKSAISNSQPIVRLDKPLTAEKLAELGNTNLETFYKTREGGFQNIEFEDINKIREISPEIQLSELDFFWLYGRSVSENNKFPGFRGFMEKCTKNEPFEISRIKILPFINAPDSNMDTICTSLLEAEKLRLKLEQEYMFITFDSPLFWKGQEIKTHVNLPRIILRLGGLHLWFSYTSAIYYIMNGSGLRELFTEMFAENSCEKVLNGTAYSRSVRAHLLMHAALGKIIMNECNFTEEEKNVMNNVLTMEGPQLKEFLKNIHFQSAYKKFHGKLERLNGRGPTAQLWVQCFQLITIMKLFIEAERSGNFALHLDCCQRMLPICYATGHFQYVKCLMLYLLQMHKLCDRLDYLKMKGNKKTKEEWQEQIELIRFIDSGYFTIRRTDNFWSGTWADMVIEQGLMRLMESRGGLTHGRSVSESVQTQWTLCTPAMADLNEQLQTYSKVHFTSSEQHKDSMPSRMKRDFADLFKILNFFRKNNPFPHAPILVSLGTGVKGGPTINCHEAFDKGNTLLARQIEVAGTFGNLKFQRKDLVKSLQEAFGKIILENDDIITVDPTQIFHRVIIAVNLKQNLLYFLEFELAPYPLSLFENGIMRKTDKAKFLDNFLAIKGLPDKRQYVIDGGYLLKKYVWSQKLKTQKDLTYSELADTYVTYLRNRFKKTSNNVVEYCKLTVVFDGYNKIGTKSVERTRRKNIAVGKSIDINKDTIVSEKNQEHFFKNDENKQAFINVLIESLEEHGICTVQANEDADTKIVETAIEKNTAEEPAVIVGSDTDLLVIMTHWFLLNGIKIYFEKDVKGKIVYYDSDSFIHSELKSIVLFLHAFMGCDTTSAFFNHGKNKLVKLLLKNPTLVNKITIFNNQQATQLEIANAGNEVVLAMYGAKPQQNMKLNEFRYYCYDRNAHHKAEFDFKTLPPSDSAAKCHSYRVFCQIQLWSGQSSFYNNQSSPGSSKLQPLEWGWKFDDNTYKPLFVGVNDKLVPEEILLNINCNCEKGCKGNCSCRKNGLKCSLFCGHCKGQDCDNKITEYDFSENDDVNEAEMDEVLIEINEQQDTSITNDTHSNDEFESDECESEIEVESNDSDTPPAKKKKSTNT